MFGNYTYLVYTLVFTLPLLLILWITEFNRLKKQLKPILITTFFLTIFYGIILWQFALAKNLWWYNQKKILGITPFGTVLEDIIWWFFITLLISSFVIVAIDKADLRKKSPRKVIK